MLQLARRPRNSQESRGRHLEPGRDEVMQLLLRGRRDDAGGQRGADAWSPEPRGQAPDLQLGHRHEVGQTPFAPGELLGVEAHLERAPGQRVRPRRDLHDRAVGRGQALRDAAVVEVGGEAQARVEGVRGAPAALGKEERPGIDGSGEKVGALGALLAEPERQLGQREEGVRSAPPDQDVGAESDQGALGVVLDRWVQPVHVHDVAREAARLARGQDAARQLLVHAAWIDAHRAHGRGTGCGEQRQGQKQHRSPGLRPGSGRLDDGWRRQPSIPFFRSSEGGLRLSVRTTELLT